MRGTRRRLTAIGYGLEVLCGVLCCVLIVMDEVRPGALPAWAHLVIGGGVMLYSGGFLLWLRTGGVRHGE